MLNIRGNLKFKGMRFILKYNKSIIDFVAFMETINFPFFNNFYYLPKKSSFTKKGSMILESHVFNWTELYKCLEMKRESSQKSNSLGVLYE